jgi:ABC-2 type transport system ATP-binding protein
VEITRRLLGERPSEIDRVLGRTDLDFAAGQRVGTYSLGMRQRLGIARALIGQPRLLILDEPTNGLDPDGIAEVRRFIRKLPDEGVTVLLSSHLLAEVEQTVDEVALLHGGMLLAQGPLQDILAGTGEHLIAEVSDTDRALAVLRKNGVGAVPLGARVEIADVRMPPAEINRLLVNSGIAISELRRERPSLETVYMRLTENQARAREAA